MTLAVVWAIKQPIKQTKADGDVGLWEIRSDVSETVHYG